MKQLISACLTALVTVGAANAAPLCPEFLNSDSLPKKYRKLAPILSGAPSDWIITRDQMDESYVPSAEAALLLSQIVSAFEARGTKLAIVMPPPRPLIAGQSELDALAGADASFDAQAVTSSFNQMIDVVREAGAIAPNLLEVATENAELREGFYYRHDTHWTPLGAAQSAVALAGAVVATGVPAFAGREPVLPSWDATERFSERGSLADMAKAVCGAQIDPVDTPIPAFPQNAGLGLLGDAPARPRIVLAGSSFSNRYKKDAYRVADAIAGALQADVVNHSVSGGGAIGGIEGIVNAGLLQGDTPVDLVVWELPYTEGLNNIGALRQLLGALQFKQEQTAAQGVALDATGKTKITLEAEIPQMLALHLPDATLERIKADLRFENGRKQTLSLVRKRHVPAELRSDWWALSLSGLAKSDLTSITLRYDGQASGGAAKAHLW